MSEDMTYCMNKDCKKKKCERHASHIKDKTIPHSYAMYDCSAENPSIWAISRMFVDYAPCEKCTNPDTYGTICVKCGACGRKFDDKGVLIDD